MDKVRLGRLGAKPNGKHWNSELLSSGARYLKEVAHIYVRVSAGEPGLHSATGRTTRSSDLWSWSGDCPEPLMDQLRFLPRLVGTIAAKARNGTELMIGLVHDRRSRKNSYQWIKAIRSVKIMKNACTVCRRS